jgi:hypothetical protein
MATFIWNANYAFAVEVKNDNINDTNITKKFTLIADENVVRLLPSNFFHPSGIADLLVVVFLSY